MSERQRDVAWMLALTLLAMLAYARTVYLRGGVGDTRPAELLPLAVERNHDLTFEGFLTGPSHWFEVIDGRVVSRYPIVPGLCHLVPYTVARLLGYSYNETNILQLAHFTAAAITALSVAFFFLAARRLVTTRNAAILATLLYAFGTTALSVAGRALWQHGPALLFLNMTVWLLASRSTVWRLVLAGVTSGLLFWDRPLLAVFIAPLAIVVLLRERWRTAAYAIGASTVLAMMAWYTLTYWKAPGLGQMPLLHLFRATMWDGFTGLLFSPNRGLFVFTPAFLFSIVPLAKTMRHPREQALLTALAIGSVALVLVCSFWKYWWGGHSLAYRLLTELAPALCLFFAIAWETMHSRVLRGVALALVAASIYMHALLAYIGPCGFNPEPNDIDQHEERLWSVRDSELARCQSQLLRRLTR